MFQTIKLKSEYEGLWGSHLAVAEQAALLEGEQDHVSVLRGVLEADLLRPVLEDSGRLVDDPVRAEERHHQAARCPGNVNADVHGHLAVRFAGKAHGEELRHVPGDLHVSVPVAALVLDQR